MSKTKLILIRILFLGLLIATFALIFHFSSQIAEESDGVSKGLLTKLINVFPYTKHLSVETKLKLVEHGNPIIRKLAHFSIYAAVGVWIMAFMSTFQIRLYKKWFASMAVGVAYAALDEYHQSFVAGRGPQLMDVGIDSLGVLTGIFVVLIVISIYRALKGDKENNQRERVHTL
ncbi:MAG: VanZ family protein [Clostridia bacterium]|nr:VanZ family protein [Clostridia bacterium]